MIGPRPYEPSASSSLSASRRGKPSTLLWHVYGPTVPYLFAAASVAIATAVIAFGRGSLARVDEREPDAATEAAAVLVGDAA